MADLIIDTDLPSQRHNKRINQYIRKVANLYGVTIDDIVSAVRQIELSPDRGFSFDDFPSLKGKTDKIFDKFSKSLHELINSATEAEWIKAGKEVDTAINKLMDTTRIDKKRLQGYGDRNLKALGAFQNRKTNGMNLSDRVWKQTAQFRQELEMSLDIGIGEGRSAAQLSRDVRQYLNHPDKLFKRVRNKHGNLVLSKAAKLYHPGQGAYRSSFKNARRMTATETNMAYKESDNLRWQKLDFVVGVKIQLSNNHTINGRPFSDICDTLAGKYPKDFKFTGWHPLCRCFAIPIMMTTDEIIETNQMLMNGEDISGFKSKNQVNDVPANFKTWVKDNADRIERAKNKPYFIQNNGDYIKIEQTLISNLQEKENEIRNRKESEKIVLFDPDGNIILEKSGGKSSVSITKDELTLFKNNTLTHNHPSGWAYDENSLGRIGRSFSVEDINMAIRGDLVEVRAVTPLYTFVMKRPNGGWNMSVSDLNTSYDKIDRDIMSDMQHIIFNIYKDKNADLAVSRANALHHHLIWKEFSKKYGVEYLKFANK